MKAGRYAAAAAVAVASVNAQSSGSVSYTTVTLDECPTSVVDNLVTITNGVTVTYCPECDMAPTSAASMTHTTVYTTTYLSLCPTGTVPVTYTITESCTGPTPTFSNTMDNYIPPDFTVTVKTCHVCDATPIPVTITEPCGCKATGGVPYTTMPAPTGSPAPPAPGAPAPSGPGCPGPNCNGGSSTTTVITGQCPGPQCMINNGGSPGSSMAPVCPGPQCGMVASGSASGMGTKPAPTQSASVCPGPQCRATSTPVAYKGAASSISMAGVCSSILIAAVAALAFGL